jgi:hypothetical protein
MEVSDIRYISIECSKCHVKTVLDVDHIGIDKKQSIPRECGSCGNGFGELNHAVGSLVRGYNEAKDLPDKVRFEIPRLLE